MRSCYIFKEAPSADWLQESQLACAWNAAWCWQMLQRARIPCGIKVCPSCLGCRSWPQHTARAGPQSEGLRAQDCPCRANAALGKSSSSSVCASRPKRASEEDEQDEGSEGPCPGVLLLQGWSAVVLGGVVGLWGHRDTSVPRAQLCSWCEESTTELGQPRSGASPCPKEPHVCDGRGICKPSEPRRRELLYE